MRIIDSHAHIFQSIAGFGAEGELRAIGDGFAEWATGRKERIIPEGLGETSFTAETYLSLMDRYNIERAVLLQGGLLGFNNSYLKKVSNDYPERFVAAAAIDPFCRKSEEILENLLPSFKIFKFESSTGCGLMGIHNTFRLDGKMMRTLYSRLNEKGAIVAFDLGSPGDESHQFDAIINIAKDYKNLKIVICHLGSVKQKQESILIEELESVKRVDNIFYDVAALMWKTRPEEYPFPIAQHYTLEARNKIGIERLMWGTDAPTTLTRFTMDQMIDAYKEILTDKEAEFFFYKNAKELYF